MESLGKVIIIFGAVLVVMGLLLVFANKIPYLGKLPGDILIQRKNFTLYFPVATSVILSIILSVILSIFLRK